MNGKVRRVHDPASYTEPGADASVAVVARLEAADQLHGGRPLGTEPARTAPGLAVQARPALEELFVLPQVGVLPGRAQHLDDQVDRLLPVGTIPEIAAGRVIGRSVRHRL